MDTRKVGNVTIDASKLKRLEELVDLVDEDYDYDDTSDNPLIREIVEITGSTLDDDAIYYEHCNHYSGAHSLDEVVYALLNNGEYPDTEEYEINFWKTCGKTDLSNEYIYTRFRHRKDKTIEYALVLEDFYLSEILTWIEKQFPGWNRRDKKATHGSRLDSYTFTREENEQYGIEQYIIVFVYHDQMVKASFKNIDKNIRDGLADYMKSLGNTVYYAEGREINFWKQTCDDTDYTGEDIYVAHRFRGSEDSAKQIRESVETFVLGELFSVITDQYPDWVKTEIERNPDYLIELHTYNFRPTDEYAQWWQFISIVVYNDSIGSVTFNNVEKNARNIITENMKTLGYSVYYNDKNKRYPKDYIFTK